MTGVAVPRPPAGETSERLALLLGLAAAGIAAAVALAIAYKAGVKGLDGVADTVRAAAAFSALLVACGYAPARLALPRAMWPHFALFVPAVGAAVGGILLTVLGFMHVPFEVSLSIVAGGLAVAGIAVRIRMGPARPDADEAKRAGGRLFTLGWPAYIAILLIAICLVPVYRDGFATLLGANPDGMLGAGTAQNLQHVVPGEVDASLPVDTVPSVWRSKYPIYYLLAGAASISGLDPVNVFPGVAAVLVALTAAAFLLFARYALRAGPGASVLAMGLVASDRVVAHLGLHPYFNQLWGTLALPMMLLFGFRFIREPTRRDGILLLLFLAFGLAAYPLMILFPAVALGTALWLTRRDRSGIWARKLRLPDLPLWVWIPIGIVAFPAALGLVWAVLEKVVDAADILLGGQSLAGWSGDLKHHLDPDWFFGVTGPIGYLGFAAVLGLGVLGLRRTERSVAVPLQAVVGVALALVVYFRIRDFGQYFEFKVLAFLFPVLLTGVAVYAGSLTAGGLRATRGLAGAGISAVLLLAMGTGAGEGGPRDAVAGAALDLRATRLGEGAAGRLEHPTRRPRRPPALGRLHARLPPRGVAEADRRHDLSRAAEGPQGRLHPHRRPAAADGAARCHRGAAVRERPLPDLPHGPEGAGPGPLLAALPRDARDQGRQLAREPGRDVGPEVGDPVTAGRLGRVHRHVGRGEQRAVGAGHVPDHRNADAGRRAHVRVAELDRLGAHVLEHALRGRMRGLAVGARQQHRELVAAEPPDQVGLARLGGQRVGDVPEEVVAGAVAVGVVDQLEPVDVEQQQGQLGSARGARARPRARGRPRSGGGLPGR